MYVLVTQESGATVREHDDLKRLNVQLRDIDTGAASAALVRAGLGTLDGEHAWLNVSTLRALNDDPRWLAGFDAMIAYAREHGWVSADSTRVRAHVQIA